MTDALRDRVDEDKWRPQSSIPFTPTPPDASALVLRVVPCEHGQFSIENGAGSLGGEFGRYYVHLSGYCGVHDPNVFAAAPEMTELLRELVRSYDEANPARMGDMHRADCKCIRCFRDRAEALHARATGVA